MPLLRRVAFALAALLLTLAPARADFETAMAAYLAGDLEGAYVQFEPLAQSGDPESQNQVGLMLGAGLGAARDDRAAARWFERAAAQGHVRARANLARLYLLGLGVVEDRERAAELYKQAALAGYVKAQAALGNLYARGWGVPRDRLRAYFWWTLAARQGDHESLTGREDMAYNMTPHQIRIANWLIENWDPGSPAP
jgi:TPR repeat protein